MNLDPTRWKPRGTVIFESQSQMKNTKTEYEAALEIVRQRMVDAGAEVMAKGHSRCHISISLSLDDTPRFRIFDDHSPLGRCHPTIEEALAAVELKRTPIEIAQAEFLAAAKKLSDLKGGASAVPRALSACENLDETFRKTMEEVGR